MITQSQPESKRCQGCGTVFARRPAPLDSAFRWMRRKFCSAACSRARIVHIPARATAAAGTEGGRP